MSDDAIQNLNPFILPQSSLYQAAVKLAAKRELQKAADPEPPLFFNVSQINALLNRYGAKYWTFEEIKNFPMAQLKPNERQFIRFLQQHPQTFYQLASLDRHPETLSIQDIKIAARLAGDALVLSTDDLKYLKELPKPASSPPKSRTFEQQHHFDADDIQNFLKKFAPDGITFEELHHLQPGKLSGQEEEIWRLLQTRSVQKILYNLSQPTQGVLTADVIRTMLSLIWNPSILGTAPIVFLKSPEFEDEEDVPNVDAVPEVESEEQSGNNRFRLRAKIKWRASQLQRLLHNINPETDHVTLEQLRRYHPRNDEERFIMNILKQASVFELLAGQDHAPEDLSMMDIELALIEKTLILSDPYITLVIIP
jgi:hypothetical protein